MKKESQDTSFRVLHVLHVYKRLLSKHPFTFVVIILMYILILFFMVSDYNLIDFIRAPFEAPILRERIRSFQEMEAEKDAIISRLTQSRDGSPLFRQLKFDEAWKNDEAKININRLLEYAAFAISKDDFTHARRLYDDASQIQETISVHYYQGRLAYLEGNLKHTINSWTSAVKLDTDRKYPILRLYLGIVFYEMGDDVGANRFIKEYSEGL